MIGLQTAFAGKRVAGGSFPGGISSHGRGMGALSATTNDIGILCGQPFGQPQPISILMDCPGETEFGLTRVIPMSALAVAGVTSAAAMAIAPGM